MFKDHEKAKNVAATIQSAVLSLAVAIGGGWSGWEFYKFNAVEKAKAELESLQNEIDQKAVVNIKLSATNRASKDSGKHIEIKAVLTNTGKKDAYLDYSEPVIYVSKISFNTDGVIEFDKPISSYIYMPGGHIPNALIRNNERKEYPFLIQVNGSGTYLIRFVAKVTDDNKRTPSSNKNYDGEWSQQMFHTVK